jgi:zeta-carotene desaturase
MAGPIRAAQGELKGRSQVAASAGETVEQWLRHNGQTRRLREMLWEPLALAALNQSAREAAAPPFARVLAKMFGPRPQDAALGLPLCPLDELYAEPARARIVEGGGAVSTASPAQIIIENNAVVSVEARGARVPAARVISAVPWFALPELFAGNTASLTPLLRAASSTGASPIVSVNAWLDRRVLAGAFLGLPGRTFQWVFDKGQMLDGQSSHLTLVSSGAESIVRLSNDELTGRALGELRDAIPEARRAVLIKTSVVRERRATFSLAPGQPARPGCRTPVAGLVLAGDWIDTGLPATIEGAAVSGRRAAEAVS